MKGVLVFGLFLLAPVRVAAEEGVPSYVRDIKPLFANYCVRCHQGRKAKAGVDLTSVQAMQKPARRNQVMLVPGKPDASRIQLTMEGKRPVMPPKKAKEQPSAREIAQVRAWIAAGAKDDSEKK